MNYLKAYEEAMKKGNVKKENIDIHEFSEVGEVVVGLYRGSEERNSEKFKGTYYTHLLMTDNGPVSIAPGVIVDKVLLQEGQIDKVFAITYLGKQKGKTGNEFNQYKVESFLYATE